MRRARDFAKYFDGIRRAIRAYKNRLKNGRTKEVINGVAFYYNPSELSLTDEVIDELKHFSLLAEDRAYAVFSDNGRLRVW